MPRAIELLQDLLAEEAPNPVYINAYSMAVIAEALAAWAWMETEEDAPS